MLDRLDRVTFFIFYISDASLPVLASNVWLSFLSKTGELLGGRETLIDWVFRWDPVYGNYILATFAISLLFDFAKRLCFPDFCVRIEVKVEFIYA